MRREDLNPFSVCAIFFHISSPDCNVITVYIYNTHYTHSIAICTLTKLKYRFYLLLCPLADYKGQRKKTSNTTNTHGLLYNFRMLLSVQHPSLDVILFLFFFCILKYRERKKLAINKKGIFLIECVPNGREAFKKVLNITRTNWKMARF